MPRAAARRMPRLAVDGDPQAVFLSEGELLLYQSIKDAGLEMPTHYGKRQYKVDVGTARPRRRGE